jgi:aminoglycoside 3-N-acetyltransferase
MKPSMIKSCLKYILGIFPIVEVIVKNIAARSRLAFTIRHWFSKITFKIGDSSECELLNYEYARQELKTLCLEYGVITGDILLVHSTSDIYQRLGLSPAEAIQFLRDLVGETGTLAMPCFPIIKGNPKGIDLFDDMKYTERLTYDVNRSSPWTGILAKQLMQTPGSVRSRNPINSMVALGPHAVDMMKHNIEAPCKPHGIGSSWHYCYMHNAKILLLNCDPGHTLTMVHVKEDTKGDKWPIPLNKWYRKRDFFIKDGDFTKDITVLERRATWNVFFAEQNLSRNLVKSELVRTRQIKNINVSFCESSNLCDYLDKSKNIDFPYKIPNLVRVLFKVFLR